MIQVIVWELNISSKENKKSSLHLVTILGGSGVMQKTKKEAHSSSAAVNKKQASET